MSWFKRFFKRNSDGHVTVTTDVPVSTIKRWYIYDTAPDGEDAIASLVGLSPVSEEGHLKERQDSELRLKNITHLIPYIDLISEVASESVANMQFDQMKKAGIVVSENEEEELEVMKMIYQAIAMASLVGGLSIAVHLGIVRLDAISSELAEGDYYGE